MDHGGMDHGGMDHGGHGGGGMDMDRCSMNVRLLFCFRLSGSLTPLPRKGAVDEDSPQRS